MAARSPHGATRLAVERARARIPGFVPESVEVVELVRNRPYFVVWTSPSGLVVLDEHGRVVRGRERLRAIGGHLDAVRRFRAALREAKLERRREHVRSSASLLDGIRPADGPELPALLDRLESLRGHLEQLVLELERQGNQPPTERTLRRAIALLNEAARADREVVRATRSLAALAVAGPPPPRPDTLARWLAARLASTDLPFFHLELDELERSRFVGAFVTQACARS